MSLTPHLVVPEAAEAADFYRRAFGAREVSRVPLPGGRVMTVELELGGASLHVGSEFKDFGILSAVSIGQTATVLQLDVPDADAAWARARAAGAEVRSELADQFWGERHGQLVDPFGHRWNIAQHVRDVAPEEVARAAAEVFGSG